MPERYVPFMVRPSIILISAFLIGLFACKAKQDKLSSVSINEITTDIAKTNVLMGDAVGIAGERPAQWYRYEVLCSKATDKELLTLTKDTNAVVRCYAFQALAERSRTRLFPVIVQHLSDTTTIHKLYGCLGGSQRAGDFFLEIIRENKDTGTFNLLSEKERVIIDSLLLFNSNNRLQARDELLAEIQPLERYYERLKQIAIAEKSKVAVVALAKYRKQQDKPLIAELLQEKNNQFYGFAAVVNFPDRSFFPILKQTLTNEVTKNNGGNDRRIQLLYQAIVQYKDQTSRQLLQSVLKEAKGMQSIYHSDYLHQALKKYPAAIYDGLLKPIYAVAQTETAAQEPKNYYNRQIKNNSASTLSFRIPPRVRNLPKAYIFISNHQPSSL